MLAVPSLAGLTLGLVKVRAVVVNHNSSPYAELVLRSLVQMNADADLDVTVLDNASTDDASDLREFAAASGIRYIQSGRTTLELGNSHGEVLRQFVLSQPATDALLFLDADVCFLHGGTVSALVHQLNSSSRCFAVQARIRLFVTEVLGKEVTQRDHVVRADGTRIRVFPRPHPFCLLVRDSPAFRGVVEHVGLSGVTRHAVTDAHAGFYDTFGMAAAAMRTHGLDWEVSEVPVLHYAQGSMRGDPDDLMRLKDEDCVRRLTAARAAWPPT